MKLLYLPLCVVLCSCAVVAPFSNKSVTAGIVAPPSATQEALAQDKRFRSLVDSINQP